MPEAERGCVKLFLMVESLIANKGKWQPIWYLWWNKLKNTECYCGYVIYMFMRIVMSRHKTWGWFLILINFDINEFNYLLNFFHNVNLWQKLSTKYQLVNRGTLLFKILTNESSNILRKVPFSNLDKSM